ncbi:nucleoside 2-deoxyribosyltransferase [Kerstersia gyiorum]|nr:nucleoside 2-deoxyribosyltransferase [Kerstersia gyiorum]KAB0544119.1 nucleoside 2-deoxyribosyltransferase [Kerstersia gyiorum]MCO7640521.1 nucleoside 2-deoxyribosyltransferase [Pseudomonas sp. S 311-6]MCR4157842.1 nucleoside 2-deoxyribosyltransferase [Kerstersia gyiorum]QBR42147.1 nucleoside 2-deoxyribosyltransferase [Kerstersia gyiorum]
MMKIYLAGFDVFRPDALVHGASLKAACADLGLEGLYPLDNQAPGDLSGLALAQWICAANLALIDSADMVMANLNPFRGHEPDSGTVFETGYAVAQGKPVWGYTHETGPLLAQIPGQPDEAGRPIDAQGYVIEDFGLPLNLMLACRIQIVHGDARECLQRIAQAVGSAG